MQYATILDPARRTLTMLLLAVGGCVRASTEPGGIPKELKELPRPLSTSEQRVIDAGNDFSFALFRELSAAKPGENIFVSPLSASMALGMTMNGAAGATYDAMRQTLGFGSADQQQINAGYQSLLALLRELDRSTELEVANSVWYRQGFPFLSSFLDATKSTFDAEVRGLDFNNAPATLSAVNGWVDAKTRHKIPSILDQVDPSDVMYLLNAIYFKGSWRLRFDPEQTRTGTFHAATGGDQAAVRFMHKEDTVRYVETETLQAAELLYGNGAFAMTVMLPKPGLTIDAFASSLARADFGTLAADLRTRKIILDLPKFTLSYERRLNDDLTALGMGLAFDPARADFSRMAQVSAGNNLYISFVKQKAYVDVNEEGTEAAAVTAVGVSVTSMPVIPTMRVDRPFVFVIRERLSGTLLFMGKITRVPGG